MSLWYITCRYEIVYNLGLKQKMKWNRAYIGQPKGLEKKSSLFLCCKWRRIAFCTNLRTKRHFQYAKLSSLWQNKCLCFAYTWRWVSTQAHLSYCIKKKILVHNFLEKKKIYLCSWHLPQKEGRKDMWQGIVTLVLDKELEKSRTVDMRINQNSSWVVLFLLSGSWDNIDHCLFMCRTSVSSLELYSNHWQAYVCLMATSVYNWNSNP